MVLENPAFNEVWDILREEYTEKMLNGRNPEETWEFRLRYMALQDVHYELESKLTSIRDKPRG